MSKCQRVESPDNSSPFVFCSLVLVGILDEDAEREALLIAAGLIAAIRLLGNHRYSVDLMRPISFYLHPNL
jgi:hypothetical protein